MNFKKVEKAAKKINQLLDNMRDEEHVSQIEKDLLLSYIRDLYDRAIQSEGSPTKEKTTAKEVKSKTPEPVVIREPAPAPVVKIADVVRQEIQEITNQSQPTESPIVAPAPPENSVASPIAEIIKEEIIAPSISAPKELLELFEKGSISELSDKLSQSPISDLTKCMGINERIFTVNELFDADSTLFNTTMKELDKLNSLEQARDYLVNNVAVKLNWSDASKIKKASTFVKLISRRY